MSSQLARNLQAAMDRAGKSTAETSYDARVPYQRVYYILKDKTNNPRIETLKRIADVLDVTLDDLIREDGDQ